MEIKSIYYCHLLIVMLRNCKRFELLLINLIKRILINLQFILALYFKINQKKVFNKFIFYKKVIHNITMFNKFL